MDLLYKSQRYWDNRSAGFSRSIEEELGAPAAIWWKELFHNELDSVPENILDCGTGPGFFAILLGQMGHMISAVDYSRKMLEQAKINCEKRNIPVELSQMDAQNLEFPDAGFDAVVARNLLWNLDEPEQAYKEFFRVLKPEGKLILSDGNFYLHLHDPEYEERRKKVCLRRGSDDSHRRHNDGVDFSIIENIAEQQPLSHHRRPLWDCEQLLNLGFSSIKIESNPMEDLREADDISENRLPFTFVIVAKK